MKCYFHPKTVTVEKCAGLQFSIRLTLFLCDECLKTVNSENIFEKYKEEEINRFVENFDTDYLSLDIFTPPVFRSSAVIENITRDHCIFDASGMILGMRVTETTE